MDIAKTINGHPIVVSALISLGFVYAYHNGMLNFLFKEVSKAGMASE